MSELPLFRSAIPIETSFRSEAEIVVFSGDVLDFLPQLPDNSVALIVTSPHRRAMGCEKEVEYIEVARQRLGDYFNGTLRYRPIGKPVYQPTGREKVAQIPKEWREPSQGRLLEKKGEYE